MDIDDEDVADFLIGYAQACVNAGIEPMPINALAALAQAILNESVAGAHVMH